MRSASDEDLRPRERPPRYRVSYPLVRFPLAALDGLLCLMRENHLERISCLFLVQHTDRFTNHVACILVVMNGLHDLGERDDVPLDVRAKYICASHRSPRG